MVAPFLYEKCHYCGESYPAPATLADHIKRVHLDGVITRAEQPEELVILAKALETIELLQRAVRLGYSVTFTPAQLKGLIYLLGEATLKKEQR